MKIARVAAVLLLLIDAVVWAGMFGLWYGVGWLAAAIASAKWIPVE